MKHSTVMLTVYCSTITGGAAAPNRVKDDRRSSARIGNFRPLPIQQLLSDRLENMQQWLRSGPDQHCQVWSKSGRRWRPHVGVKYTVGVTFFSFFFFFYSRARAQVKRGDRFGRKIRQNAWNGARTTLFVVSNTRDKKFSVLCPKNPQNYPPE